MYRLVEGFLSLVNFGKYACGFHLTNQFFEFNTLFYISVLLVTTRLMISGDKIIVWLLKISCVMSMDTGINEIPTYEVKVNIVNIARRTFVSA